MKHLIEIGIESAAINNGHGPRTYRFRANASVDIVGSYGISPVQIGSARTPRAIIAVDLPEWVAESSKWHWMMSRPGCKSKSGTDDLCFVVCKETAEMRCEFFGQLDGKALIQQALDSGVQFVYPEQDGSMKRLDIEYTLVRWE